jgi:ABC transporter fused permease/ATP-binding protein
MARNDTDLEGRAPVRQLPFRRLFALARPEWRTLALATFFLAIASAMELLLPRYAGRIVDALNEKALEDLTPLSVTVLVIATVQSLAIGIRYFLFTVTGERVVSRLREQLYQRILEQEVAFFDQRRTGELTNRLASDTGIVQNAVSVNISMALRNLASVLGSITVLFFVSAKLTLFMLLLVPPIMILAMFVGRRVRKLARQVQDALAAASEIAEETFSGVRTVRAFTHEPEEARRYAGAIWRAFELSRRRVRFSAGFIGATAFAGYAALAAVIWYGSQLVGDGVLSVGSLVTFLLLTLNIAVAVGSLSDLWVELMRASGASERVFEILDRKPAIPISGGARAEKAEGGISFEGVSFTYPSRPDLTVLQNINLAIAPGEIVALVGPSGSGKSTIASLIPRFYDPRAGRILFDGQDLHSLDPEWLRRQIGIVAQEPILFSTTIEDNIRYGREDASEIEIVAAAKAANADEFIRKFPEGYKTQVGERGVQLSGGQKQRIAIARAVLKNPKVLILDEATSALDAESEYLVKEALDRLMRGRTTLVIAHRLSTVKDADRVLVLSDGELVQAGKHEALLAEEGLYRRLVQRQFVSA